MVLYICPKCNKVMNRKSIYNYHVYKKKRSCIPQFTLEELLKTQNEGGISTKYECKICNKKYSTKWNLSRHINQLHEKNIVKKNGIKNETKCGGIFCPPQFPPKCTKKKSTNTSHVKIVLLPKSGKPYDIGVNENNIEENIKKYIKNTPKKTPVNEKQKQNLQDEKCTKNGFFDRFTTIKQSNKSIICKHCKKSFSRKDSLLRHTQKSCKKKVIFHKKTQKSEHNDEILREINKNASKSLVCKYCNKHFSRKDSLSRHKKLSCKRRKISEKNSDKKFLKESYGNLLMTISEMNKKIINLQKEIKKNNSNIRSNIYSEVNNINSKNKIMNINYTNVQLVAFGDEDLSFITDQYYKSILNKGFKSVPKLIEFIHFNKSKPENHNIYISNMRDNYVIIFTGQRWDLQNRDDVIKQLYDDKKLLLEDKYNELKSDLSDVTKKKFGRFVRDNSDDTVMDIKNDIKLLLYNKKCVPTTTRKLINR